MKKILNVFRKSFQITVLKTNIETLERDLSSLEDMLIEQGYKIARLQEDIKRMKTEFFNFGLSSELIKLCEKEIEFYGWDYVQRKLHPDFNIDIPNAKEKFDFYKKVYDNMNK